MSLLESRRLVSEVIEEISSVVYIIFRLRYYYNSKLNKWKEDTLYSVGKVCEFISFQNIFKKNLQMLEEDIFCLQGVADSILETLCKIQMIICRVWLLLHPQVSSDGQKFLNLMSDIQYSLSKRVEDERIFFYVCREISTCNSAPIYS